MDVLRRPVLRTNFQETAVGEADGDAGEAGGTQLVLVAAGAQGIEAQAVEDVPGAHLAAVVIAAQGVGLVAVEMVGHVADPFLAVLGLAQLVVQVQHVVAGLVAVPVAADAAPDVVRARNVVAHLDLEHIVQALAEELLPGDVHVILEGVRHRPGVLNREAFGDVAPAIVGTGPLVGDVGEGGPPVAFGVPSAHVFGFRVDEVPVVPAPREEEGVVLLVAQELGGLGDAPVVVSVFQGLGHGFHLFVERNVAQRRVFRQAVVVGVGCRGLHRLEGPLVVKTLDALHHHVGEDGDGVVADHAPGFAAVERPDGQHVLRALVEVLQHRVREVRLQGLVHEVQQGMEGAVGVPEGEGRIVRESLGLADGAVMPAEAPVDVLEQERMQGGAVHAGIEGFLGLLGAGGVQFVAGELRLPEGDRLGPDRVEVLPVDFREVFQGSVNARGRHGHMDADLLARGGRELHAGPEPGAPGLLGTAEAAGVIDDRLPVLEDQEVLDGPVEPGREMDMPVGIPALDGLAPHDRVFVQQPDRRPDALEAQGMVQVDHHEGGIAGGIGEPEHAAARGRGHLRPGAVVAQLDGVIPRAGGFRVMAEPRPVARIRVLGGPGGPFHGSRPGNEQEIAQVRDARPAQVREAEAHDRGLRIFVARRDVVVVIVRVRTDLDAAERHLRAGIHVPEAGGPDEGIDMAHKVLRRCAGRQAGRRRGQEKGLLDHGTNVRNKRLYPEEDLAPVHQPEDDEEDEAVRQGDERGIPGEGGKAVQEGFGDRGEVEGLAHGIGRDGVHPV